MYTAHVLRDTKGKLYKGVTNNIGRRLNEYRGGHTRTTSRMSDIYLVYSENFDNFNDARKREIYFKTAAGRRFLKKILGR
jgi:putative endonuclease